MSVSEDLARHIIQNQREELEKIDVDSRRERAKNIRAKVTSMPMFQQDLTDNQTLADLYKLENEKRRDDELWIQSGGSPDALSGLVSSELATTRRNLELQAQGVKTDLELPAGDWKLGFGENPVTDVKNVLSNHYNTNVTVFKSGKDIIFIDPKNKAPVKVNLGAGAKLGYGLPMAGDVAGTVLQGAPQGKVAKTVFKEATGSAIGATTGELLRLSIGKAFGVHDLDVDDMIKKSLAVGGEAGAFTGGVGGLMASAKGVENFIKGGIFTKDEAIKHGLSVEEAEAAIREVNEIIARGGGTGKVKGTLYQKTGDVNIGGRQAELERTSEHAARFAEREATDKAGTKEALDIINRSAQAPYAGLETVSDVAQARKAVLVEKKKQIVQKNQMELDRQLSEMGKIQKENVGETTIKYIEGKRAVADNFQSNEWERVKQVGNYNAEKARYGIDVIEGSETAKLKKQYAARGREATTKVAAKGVTSIYKTGKEGARPPEDAYAGFPAVQRLMARVKAGDKSKKPQLADLENYNREISGLKADLRAMYKSRQAGDIQTRDLGEVIRAMESDRKSALLKSGKKDLLEQIEAAEAATAKYHETYTRSVVGDLLAKNDAGVPNIKSKSFVDNMLTRDEVEVNQFVDIIGDNPGLVLEWKEGLANAYKRKVFNEGRFNKRMSNEWIKANEKILNKFFDEKEIASFKRTGQLAEKVADQGKRLDRFMTAANNKWGAGALSSKDPEGMINFITDKSGSWQALPTATRAGATGGRKVEERLSKIRYVKNMTKSHPAAWQTVQNDFKQKLQNDIIDAASGDINSNKLAKWVSESQNSKVVEEVMGKSYLNDLSRINKVVQMLEMTTKTLKRDETTKAGIQGIRAAIAPPLTRRGRAFTAALTWDSGRSHKVMANAILDERTMREVAEFSKQNPFTRRFVEKAFSLGFMLPESQ